MADDTTTNSIGKDNKVQCLLIPSAPTAILLPAVSVVEVVANPVCEKVPTDWPAWRLGYAEWRNQKISTISFEALHTGRTPKQSNKVKLVVLNPTADSIRKSYSGLICHGEVKPIVIDETSAAIAIPDGIDKRYVSMALKIGKKDAIIPDLKALGVVFAYG